MKLNTKFDKLTSEEMKKKQIEAWLNINKNYGATGSKDNLRFK